MYNEFDNQQQDDPITVEVRGVEDSKPPKKRNNAAGFAGIILAVVLIAGASGFGGAFLSNNMLRDSQLNTAQTKASETRESHPNLAEVQGTQETLADNSVSTSQKKGDDGSYLKTADLVEDVKPTVVQVRSHQKQISDETLLGTGSGIVISENGYIITNSHVIEQGSVFSIIIFDNEEEKRYPAKLIGNDKSTDIAVLKIEATGLKTAVLGDSDSLRVGDAVVAIGNPAGLIGTVTQGIVSGLDRQTDDTGKKLSSIQTDAAVNFGNSGGAMFDMKGRVVGIVNAKIITEGADNLGFAITINEAKPVVDDLLTKGYVSGRPVLGITFLTISDYMAQIEGKTAGLLVTEINSSLEVAKSGLKVGDTIVQIEGKDVLSLADVTAVLNDKKPGDVIKLKVVRIDTMGDKSELDINVTISEYRGN